MTEPARMLYVIDDRQIIRAFMAYPMVAFVEAQARKEPARQAVQGVGVAIRPGHGRQGVVGILLRGHNSFVFYVK